MPTVTLYWRIKEGYLELVKAFLEDLILSGFGKRKSVGYGTVESFDLHEYSGFTAVDEANGFVTLSRFVPAETDPIKGFWNTTVKYGRLGDEFSLGNPFKRPLVQIETGACFYDPTPRDWYGQLIAGLSPREEVKHYGFAFTLPIHLPDLAPERVTLED